jgi:hypothetical protein
VKTDLRRDIEDSYAEVAAGPDEVAAIGEKIIAAQQELHRLKREPELARQVRAWLKDRGAATERAANEVVNDA